MPIYFSPSLVAFYDNEINEVLPPDAIEITAGLRAEVLAAQATGLKIIGVGSDGKPVTLDRPTLPHPELVEQAKVEIRAQRQPIILVLNGLQSSALTLGLLPRAQSIETAIQGLRDLTQIDLSACTTYEEMRLAVKSAYMTLASALPADVRKAFSDALK